MAKKNNSINDAPSGRDPFHALCLLASREDWCWKLTCTTCGHMHFRYAFRELIAGKHPDAPGWVVSQHPPQSLHKLLGDLPRGRWPIEDQRKLADILTRTDLREIHKACRFPDWLGYLGLALATSEDAECLDRKITLSLVPQFMELAHQDKAGVERLAAILAGNDTHAYILNIPRYLRWSDLEWIESVIKGFGMPPDKDIPLLFR